MNSSAPNPGVNFFFTKAGKWQQEYLLLREIALASGLTEELKWGHPCYTFENKNVVLIHGFKDYCALLFIKGVLMKDPKKILIQQTENVQAGRQIRFTSLQQITKLAPTLKAYIKEATAIEKSGQKVVHKKTSAYKVPVELKDKLEKDAKLNAAFNALTPGRQRGYLFHFSQAKQSSTRTARIEKYIPKILAGKGFND